MLTEVSITFLRTAGLVAIRDQALLLAYSRHKGTWYLPGGEVYAGETTTEALVREIREELNVELNLARLKLYDRIKERPAGRG
ncbi:NUDIX domain-containing protein [Chitinophaga costaii]|uniref:NUDIX domain-containing protein n=1 Tax=Chitinophaga costaii TaxID=1335309 RepID=UPI000B7D0897|nr:NUDIX domain-containing protein [Chitinophaga costaii]PUZ24413.1 NUDIX domain-containing protein [Chitinophaga costaii]